MIDKIKYYLKWFFVYVAAAFSLLMFFLIEEQVLLSKTDSKSKTMIITNGLPGLSQKVQAQSMEDTRVEPFSALQLNTQLKWKFEDIIFIYQQDDNNLTIHQLLLLLAQSLQLSTVDRDYLIELFSRYKAYKMALVPIKHQAIATKVSNLDETIARLDNLQQLQYEFFSIDEISGLFSDDNRYDQQAIARMQIMRDTSLSAQAKSDLLKHQISQMDAADIAVLQPSLAASTINTILQHTAINSTDALVTDQAIKERAEAFKQDNQHWLKRVHAVTQMKLDMPYEQLEQYVEQHFSAAEQKRLQVYINNPQLYKG